MPDESKTTPDANSLNRAYSRDGLRGVYRAGLAGLQGRRIDNPKPGEIVIDFAGQFRGSTAARLAAEAKRRNQEPAALAAEILETVIDKNLFAAVIDD